MIYVLTLALELKVTFVVVVVDVDVVKTLIKTYIHCKKKI